MPAAKETAYVLREGHATSSEPQVFQGIPGLWVEGEPVAVSALGLSDAQTADLVADLGLPFDKVSVEVEERDDSRTGGLISGADLRSENTAGDFSDRSPIPGLTQGEFDDRVAEEAELGVYSPVIEAALDAAPELAPEIERSWPKDHAGFDALAKDHDFVFGEDVRTLAEKQASLESAGIEMPVTVTPADGS